MRQSQFASLLLCLLLPVSGCGDARGRISTIGNAASSHKPAFSNESGRPCDRHTFTIVDSLDRTITLDKQPERIVSLSPGNTELAFAIGVGQQVVGVTSYCDYPPEARQRQQVGGFSSSSLSTERIVRLQPDLVISDTQIHRPVIAQLERLSIPVVALEAESFEDLYRNIRLLAHITSHDIEATRLIQAMRSRIDEVAARVGSIGPQQRVRVFYQIWDEPLTAAGPACFVGRMIEQCGGINIITGKSTRYPQLSEEVLLDSNPDVILSATMASKPITRHHFIVKPAWRKIAAVQNNRIHIIDGNLISRFGPRSVDALEAMARALYPQRFAADRDTAKERFHVLEGPQQ